MGCGATKNKNITIEEKDAPEQFEINDLPEDIKNEVLVNKENSLENLNAPPPVNIKKPAVKINESIQKSTSGIGSPKSQGSLKRKQTLKNKKTSMLKEQTLNKADSFIIEESIEHQNESNFLVPEVKPDKKKTIQEEQRYDFFSSLMSIVNRDNKMLSKLTVQNTLAEGYEDGYENQDNNTKRMTIHDDRRANSEFGDNSNSEVSRNFEEYNVGNQGRHRIEQSNGNFNQQFTSKLKNLATMGDDDSAEYVNYDKAETKKEKMIKKMTALETKNLEVLYQEMTSKDPHIKYESFMQNYPDCELVRQLGEGSYGAV